MVALGFSVHTGWAALVATDGKSVLERRRVEMMAGGDPDAPAFVYHRAAKQPLALAEKLVRDAEAQSFERARAALADLRAEAAAIVGAATGLPPLAAILASHPRIHAAEGALYRRAIRRACESLGIRVQEIRARDLPTAEVDLAAIGRGAGKPWAKDQKDAFCAAMLAGYSPAARKRLRKP